MYHLRTPFRLGAPIALWLLALLMLVGCNDDLEFDSLTVACDDDNRCAAGYVCVPSASAGTRVCVYEGRADVVLDMDSDVETTQPDVDDVPLCGLEWRLDECRQGLNSACCQSGTGPLASCDDGGPECTCTQVGSDENNCGECGNVCPSGSTCYDGQCTCPVGFLNCGSGCVDILSESATCGGCQTSCDTGQQCIDGACLCESNGSTILCSTGETCCNLSAGGMGCIDMQSSLSHCGGCGIACGAGEICQDGQCMCGTSAGSGSSACDTATGDICCGNETDGFSCAPPSDGACFCANEGGPCGDGALCCNDTCVMPATDLNNCGSCGTTCDRLSDAAFVCVDGACRCSGASPHECNGACTNFQDDEANCGACGMACAGNETCCNGSCRSLVDDDTNCGVCGTICTDGTCCSGQCQNLVNDPAHCGACGHSCHDDPGVAAGNNSTCSAGVCVYDCTAEFENCNNSDLDGCETSLNTVSNCGACGNVCSPQETCSSGACHCDTGAQEMCDARLLPHVQAATCMGGGDCAIVCDSGWSDSNNTSADGCECDIAGGGC